MLTYKQMRDIARKQFAVDLNCSPDDFVRDGIVFCEARENPGRRPFLRGERHFEMYTMGGAVIVSATPDILPYIRKELDGKTRDEAFCMPFVYGPGHIFLPDDPAALPMPGGFDYEMLEQNAIFALYERISREDFPHSVVHDINHPRPDILAVSASVGGKVVGLAGASDDCEMMWQIGIDVLPEYRGHGLAMSLTNMLALEIMRRGKVPYYAASMSNIASQRTAYRAGFEVAYTVAFRGRFDGEMTSPTG